MQRRSLNHSMEQTRASRFDLREFVSVWRLARAAHADRYARARTHRFIQVKPVGAAVSALCCFATDRL
jgi:hypothetical protein